MTENEMQALARELLTIAQTDGVHLRDQAYLGALLAAFKRVAAESFNAGADAGAALACCCFDPDELAALKKTVPR